MAVALLFTGFTRHPKIKRAGEKAGWLFVHCLEYCAEFGTDGFVPAEAVNGFALPGTPARLKALLYADERSGPLLHVVPGGYEVNDYLQWNRTARELEASRRATSKARSAAGRRGAEARWGGKMSGNASGKRDGIAIGNGCEADGSVSGSVSGPSLTSSSPSTKPKRRASHPTADHHEPKLDELLEQVVERVCAKRPEWKPVLVKGAAVKAAARATSVRRAAVALLCVASDPKSQVPIRVLSDGWWWDENDSRYLQAVEQMEAVAS